MKTEMSKKEAVKYLENVLEHWDGFCEGHRLFIEAITVLLEEEQQQNNEQNA